MVVVVVVGGGGCWLVTRLAHDSGVRAPAWPQRVTAASNPDGIGGGGGAQTGESDSTSCFGSYPGDVHADEQQAVLRRSGHHRDHRQHRGHQQ